MKLRWPTWWKFKVGERAQVNGDERYAGWYDCTVTARVPGRHMIGDTLYKRVYLIHVDGKPNPDRKDRCWFCAEPYLRKINEEVF